MVQVITGMYYMISHCLKWFLIRNISPVKCWEMQILRWTFSEGRRLRKPIVSYDGMVNTIFSAYGYKAILYCSEDSAMEVYMDDAKLLGLYM
jgi:hypothetical protein